MTETVERSFAMILSEAEDGRLLADLTTAYRKLVMTMVNESSTRNAAVKGSISVKFDLMMSDDVIELVPSFTVTEPKPKRSRSIFWPDSHGNMSRKNPRQTEMQLRTVSEEAQTFRTVSA